MASAWLPPVLPWSPTDKSSFAYQSVAHRWPTIITSAIDSLYQASYALSYSSNRILAEKKTAEAKIIIERLSKLKHDMGRDRPLEVIGNDGGDVTDDYDRIVKSNEWTWFTAPWLFAECYLYRLLRSFFARSQHWQQYDPFSAQKVKTFQSSGTAIEQLSSAVEDLIQKAKAFTDRSKSSLEGLQVIFRELVQTSLWGNATDLSLLTNLTHADIQHLQAGGIGAEAQSKRQQFILSDLQNIDEAWNAIVQAGPSSRIDIILDNSGFELFTDLLLADFILSTGLIDKIVFHPKDMPWFVSDVTPADFIFTIEALQSKSFFLLNSGKAKKVQDEKNNHEASQLDNNYFLDARSRSVSPSRSFVMDSNSVLSLAQNKDESNSSNSATQRLASKWADYLEKGRFELSIPSHIPLGGLASLHDTTQADFWTSYHNYPSLPLAAPTLFQYLQGSGLVISKGDLNYRKWCSDACWSFSEPFVNVLGPVKGTLNLLVLRTNKADVCVGVPKERVATLQQEDKQWRTNGKYAMVEFVAKESAK